MINFAIVLNLVHMTSFFRPRRVARRTCDVTTRALGNTFVGPTKSRGPTGPMAGSRAIEATPMTLRIVWWTSRAPSKRFEATWPSGAVIATRMDASIASTMQPSTRPGPMAANRRGCSTANTGHSSTNATARVAPKPAQTGRSHRRVCTVLAPIHARTWESPPFGRYRHPRVTVSLHFHISYSSAKQISLPRPK